MAGEQLHALLRQQAAQGDGPAFAPQMALVAHQHERGPRQRAQQRPDLVAAQGHVVEDDQRVDAAQVVQHLVGVELGRQARLEEGVEQPVQQVYVGPVGGREPQRAIGERRQAKRQVAQQHALAHARRAIELERLGGARRAAGGANLIAPADQIGEIAPASLDGTRAGSRGGDGALDVIDNVIAVNGTHLHDIAANGNLTQIVALHGNTHIVL